MKKLLLTLLLIPTIVLARPIGDCNDQAGLAYYAAKERMFGTPSEVYKERIRELIEAHPEFNIPVADIPKLHEIVDKVYASNWDEEQAYINILAQCSLE